MLGPGTGLAWRWHKEHARTEVIRLVIERLKRIEGADPDLAEGELKRLLFTAENAPDLTAAEREGLVSQLRLEITRVRREAIAQRVQCY